MGAALGIALVLAACSSSARVPASGADAAPYDARRFGELPEFELVHQSGRVVTREELLGTPFVVNLFFASCAGPCPRMQGDVRRLLHDQLVGTGVRIVSISVDPVRDTPERLREYAASFTADPERWWFLTGDEARIHALVTEGLHLPVELPAAADDDVGRLGTRLELTHSTRLVAIDAEGRIAGYYGGGGEAIGAPETSPEDVERAYAALLARVRALAGLPPTASPLPLVDACLNGLATVLLVAGWIAIRRGRRPLHAGLMRAAFVTSAVFLACYLYYHATAIETRYAGEGADRVAYLVLLASHVLLAIITVPLVLWTLWLAHREDWVRHRRLARWTLPIWLYVSVTGVLVYVALYHGRSLGL